MRIEGSAVLVTGASRGIGASLVDEALRRGAREVYAAMRRPVGDARERVTQIQLDVTDAQQIEAAAAAIDSLDVLVNNAGVALPDDLRGGALLQQHLDVNLFAPLAVALAFRLHLAESGGAIVNNLSLAALASIPVLPGYSVSKAAALSLTQSLRLLAAERGVTVHAVLTGPTDTDMTRGLDIPKATPASVARAIFDGVEAGDEEIFPDALSSRFADAWRSGPAKELERQNAALAAVPAF